MTSAQLAGPTDGSERPDYHRCVADMIGGTPLVRLNAVTRGLKPLVPAKAEFVNPCGSVKDRIARLMIDQAEAEAEGLLRPGAPSSSPPPATPAPPWP